MHDLCSDIRIWLIRTFLLWCAMSPCIMRRDAAAGMLFYLGVVVARVSLHMDTCEVQRWIASV